jgi:hypothetical protein
MFPTWLLGLVAVTAALIIMNLVINAAEAIGDHSGVITVSGGAQACSSEYLPDI